MIFRALALTGVSLLSLSMPALAQNAPSREPTEAQSCFDEAIIVTARRREEALQDVPLTVNVVTGSNIQKLNIRDGSEFQTLVPGLQLRTEANGVGGCAQILGIQYDSVAE